MRNNNTLALARDRLAGATATGWLGRIDRETVAYSYVAGRVCSWLRED